MEGMLTKVMYDIPSDPTITKVTITADCVNSGAEPVVERDPEKVLEYCRANINPGVYPEYDAWYNNIAPGGKYFGDMRYFYDGWCKLEKVPHGWKYTLCKPYRDRRERGADK